MSAKSRIGHTAWVITRSKAGPQAVRAIVIRAELARGGYAGTFVDSGGSANFFKAVYFDEHMARRTFARALETKIARLERALAGALAARDTALAEIGAAL